MVTAYWKRALVAKHWSTCKSTDQPTGRQSCACSYALSSRPLSADFVAGRLTFCRIWRPVLKALKEVFPFRDRISWNSGSSNTIVLPKLELKKCHEFDGAAFFAFGKRKGGLVNNNKSVVPFKLYPLFIVWAGDTLSGTHLRIYPISESLC